MSKEDRIKQKRAAFDALYALDDSAEEEDDPGLAASLATLKGKTLGDPTLPCKIIRKTPRFSRSLSIPYPSQTSTSSASSRLNMVPARQTLDDAAAEVVKDTPNPSLRKGATFTGVDMVRDSMVPMASAIPRASGKRKRDAEIKLAPQGQRIFDRLHFYFFPNDDIHPARRMRIIKALEYGATWQRHWNSAVTHVVVDNSMKWEYVINYLTTKGGLVAKELPTNITVVNQDYPAECITFRFMVDPTQRKFLVQGYVLPQAKDSRGGNDVPDARLLPSASSQASDKSLVLKTPRRYVSERERETPSRTEETPSLPSISLALGPTNAEEIDLVAGDELELAIREAKAAEHLDLEPEHEEANPVPINVSTSDRGRPGNRVWQDRFQCMHKHTGDNKTGPNTRTMSILQEMADYYANTRDEWRQKAYRSAISALRNQSTQIATKEQALCINGIGESIAEKIEEIVVTNRLRKLDYTKLDPRQRILQTFMKIYGVGYAVAERWVSAGYRTLDDLLAKAALTPNQRIGIAHYEDFNTRIPRTEVAKHASIVKTTLHGLDANYKVYTMGSYRRGAETSGDIDLIITCSDASITKIRETICDKLVPMLTDSGFLVAALAQTSAADGTKWHGASCLPGSSLWRRIDFLLVPDDELGAALIYFTGNDIFNRSLRLLASRKGMRLNQRGLYRDVLRDAGRAKLSEGELIEGRDERKIFMALGVPWRPPQHRIC